MSQDQNIVVAELVELKKDEVDRTLLKQTRKARKYKKSNLINLDTEVIEVTAPIQKKMDKIGTILSKIKA